MKRTLIIPAALALASAPAFAQLSTEVVVDRDIVPKERTATRPTGLTPEIILPTPSFEPLEADYYSRLTSVTPYFSILPPAQGAYAAEKTPYRGYVAGGYFPLLDFGVSAGYRIIDREKMALGARLQFDSERYRPFGEDGDMGVQYFAKATAGVDFSWRPADNSQLRASADYDYLREKTTYWYPQNVNSGSIGADWHSKAGAFRYHAALKAAFEKASNTYRYLIALDESPKIDGLAQQNWLFAAGGDMLVGRSYVGLDIDGDFVHTSAPSEAYALANNATVGAVGATPYLSYSNKKFAMKLGVRLDFSRTLASKCRFTVMPDIRLDLKPVESLAVWAHAGGRSTTNTFKDIRQESVYQVFDHSFDISRIPFSIEGGVNVGPFSGFYMGVFGGYAIANDWLMASNSVMHPFAATDVKGWHAGAKAGAEWRFIKAEVKADFAPSAYDKAWYLRRDRAATVVEATVEATPIDPLTVAVGYEFRNRRKAFLGDGDPFGLGCVSNLSAGAEWRFTKALSVFARLENILGRRYMVTALNPSRKLSGLVGASYKF